MTGTDETSRSPARPAAATRKVSLIVGGGYLAALLPAFALAAVPATIATTR